MTPIVTPEKAARRASPQRSSKGGSVGGPPPPPKRSYTSQQAVANLSSSPKSQASSGGGSISSGSNSNSGTLTRTTSGGGTVTKTSTTTHQNGKVITSCGYNTVSAGRYTPELSSSSSSMSSDDSLCLPIQQPIFYSKSTGSLLVKPEYNTQFISSPLYTTTDPNLQMSKSQPLLDRSMTPTTLAPYDRSITPITPRDESVNNSRLPDCVEGHVPRERIPSIDSYLGMKSSKSAPSSPRRGSVDEFGNRPPKPPRGWVETPVSHHQRRASPSPSPSAFSPVSKANWAETCLDDVPLRKSRNNSVNSDLSTDIPSPSKRHTAPPTPTNNGYSPIKAEQAARLQYSKGVPPKTLPKTQRSSSTPRTSIIVTPPTPPQRQSSTKKKSTPPPPPQRTSSQRTIPMHGRPPRVNNQTTRGPISNHQTPVRIPDKTSPTSKIPVGKAQSQIVSPLPSKTQSSPTKQSPSRTMSTPSPVSATNSTSSLGGSDNHTAPSSPKKTTPPSPKTQEKLRVVQLKEQVAKLRSLQEQHKRQETEPVATTRQAGLQETDIDEVIARNGTYATTDATTTATTTTKVDISKQVAPATTTEVTNQH